MTAHILDTNMQLIVVDLAKNEQRTPEFLRLNPNGRVPVLDDDGFVLTESHAIMQYLADCAPKQTLYPTERRARADVNRWLFWSAHHFQPSISVLTWEHFIKPMIGRGATDPKEVKRGEELVLEHGRVLDGQLDGRRWVRGDELSLADLALATPLMYMEKGKLPLGGFSNLLRWFDRVRELEVWKKTGA